MKKQILILIATILISACDVNPSSTVAPTQEHSSTSNVGSDGLSTAAPKENEPFTTNNMNTELPNDIIREIAYFGGMGGGGDWGCYEKNYPSPTFPSPYSGSSNSVETLEIFSSTTTLICGLVAGEVVHVNVELPDGSSQKDQSTAEQITGDSQASVSFEYIPNLHNPTGKYVLTFSGEAWTLQRTINVIDADSARLYLVNNNKIIFYKFQPNEEVRLFAFHEVPNAMNNTQRLIGWKAYQLDNNGELSIDVNMEKDTRFIAVGNFTGQVIYRVPNYDGYYLFWSLISRSDFFCSGAPNPVGVKPYGYAEILTNNLPVYKYDETGKLIKAENILSRKGVIVSIDSNANCSENAFLWTISCIDKQCRWIVPESGPDGPYLRPIEELPSTPTPDPANIPACPGTKSTRLQAGMNAEVTRSGKAQQLSLRAQPSMSAKKVHVIAAGRKMEILKGPECADNSYWWYVRSEQGFEGWAREGDNEDYWIDPLP